MSHHLITFDDVSFDYPDGTHALKNVSMQVHHGDKVGLIGANGAGKSTLLQLLCGFLKPLSGGIFVGQTRVTTSSLTTIRRTLGVVFQDADDQLFMPSVLEDVAFGLHSLGVSDEDITPRALAALRRVGAEHLRDKAPYNLSGGQKRAVAIAGVLAMEPSVLVLDEPSTALDPVSRQQLITQLQQFTHSQLIATHDLDLVYDVCDRVVVLEDGKAIKDATPKEVFSDNNLLERCRLLPPLRMQPFPAQRISPPWKGAN